MDFRNGLNDQQLIEGMDELHIDMGVWQRRFLVFLAEFDRRGRWKRWGHRDAAEWVSARYGYSRYKARRCVAAAHALQHLPQIGDALADGRLNLDRVIELTRMATPETEAKLIPWARRVTAWWIGQKANMVEAKAARKAKRAYSARDLQWWWDEESTLAVHGRLTTDQGAAFVKAIERLVDRIPATPADDGTIDPIATRRADALVAMVSSYIPKDEDPDRATVILHTTPEKLAGKDLCSELEGGVPVNPKVAQLIACDARVQTIVHDALTGMMEVEDTAYTIPQYLRRLVLQRDGYRCTFPGCEQKIVDVHHMKAWPEGPTKIWNLGAACRVHHNLCHLYSWQMRLIDGVVKWFMPDGRLYDPKPSSACSSGNVPPITAPAEPRPDPALAASGAAGRQDPHDGPDARPPEPRSRGQSRDRASPEPVGSSSRSS